MDQSEAVRAFRSRYPTVVRDTRAVVYVVREPRVAVVKNIVRSSGDFPPKYDEAASDYNKYPIRK